MNNCLLEKIDEVKIVNQVQELNNLIMLDDWLLLAVITSQEGNLNYHVGHLNFNR